MKFDTFTQAYITAALWSTNDESTPNGGDPLDKNYGPEDFAPETVETIKADCKKFQEEHSEDIASDISGAGHDFWLTRNGHGCGFWDGDWPDEIGDRLTEACKAYGAVNLSVGDDGKIYC